MNRIYATTIVDHVAGGAVSVLVVPPTTLQWDVGDLSNIHLAAEPHAHRFVRLGPKFADTPTPDEAGLLAEGLLGGACRVIDMTTPAVREDLDPKRSMVDQALDLILGRELHRVLRDDLEFAEILIVEHRQPKLASVLAALGLAKVCYVSTKSPAALFVGDGLGVVAVAVETPTASGGGLLADHVERLLRTGSAGML